MSFARASGVLFHPTSLPGPYGIGDIGEAAYAFLDTLEAAGQSLWQILPLGPTSYGDSPYQTLSAFAGNPLLVSLDRLVEDGLLLASDLADPPAFPATHVDYGWVIDWHNQMLSRAYANFAAKPSKLHRDYAAWRKKNADWVDDFSLFMALKTAHGGRPWVEWEPELIQCKRKVTESGRAADHLKWQRADLVRQLHEKHAEAVDQFRFRQWLFFRQWYDLKRYANNLGIRIIGDAPIFVAHDSSDVWANQHLFDLDEMGNPNHVAGVPPDYFSATGQRWGNPLYQWDVMRKDGYRWWVRRLHATFEQVDILRIDHFRGFEAYWEVPASEPTAMIGRWAKGPADHFFNTVQAALGTLPIIAEDLGVITEEVEAMRDNAKLPGMKVLQFAWGGRGGVNEFLPHRHIPNCVVYTGTHDNNTTLGWWESGEADERMKANLTRYVGHEIAEPHWEMIRLALASVAHTAVVPMQDILGIGEDGRMNVPGRPSGNWTWRVTAEQLAAFPVERLRHLTETFGRLLTQQDGEE